MEVLVYMSVVLWFTLSFLAGWFEAGLRNKFLRALKLIPKEVTGPNIDVQLILYYGLIGELLVCKVCTSGYVAAAFGVIFMWLFDLPWWFPLGSFFLPQWIVWRLFR